MDVSPFCSFNTKEIPIPGFPGETAVIRQIGYAKKREAQRAAMKDAAALMSEFQALASIVNTPEAAKVAEKAKADAQDDPLAGFDPLTVLRSGVVSWTLKIDGRPAQVTDETLGDLDPDIMTGIAREIMRFSKREERAEQKNA